MIHRGSSLPLFAATLALLPIMSAKSMGQDSAAPPEEIKQTASPDLILFFGFSER